MHKRAVSGRRQWGISARPHVYVIALAIFAAAVVSADFASGVYRHSQLAAAGLQKPHCDGKPHGPADAMCPNEVPKKTVYKCNFPKKITDKKDKDYGAQCVKMKPCQETVSGKTLQGKCESKFCCHLNANEASDKNDPGKPPEMPKLPEPPKKEDKPPQDKKDPCAEGQKVDAQGKACPGQLPAGGSNIGNVTGFAPSQNTPNQTTGSGWSVNDLIKAVGFGR